MERTDAVPDSYYGFVAVFEQNRIQIKKAADAADLLYGCMTYINSYSTTLFFVMTPVFRNYRYSPGINDRFRISDLCGYAKPHIMLYEAVSVGYARLDVSTRI